MDPKVILLMEALECSEEEAKILLEAGDGDIEKAIHYYDIVSKAFIVVALKIEATRFSKFEGYFLIIANGKNGNLIEVNGAIIFEGIENTEIDIDWEAFKEFINKLKKSNSYDSMGTNNFIEFLQNNLDPSIVNSIYKALQNNDTRIVREKLNNLITKYFPEEIEFSFNSKLYSSANLGLKKEERGEEEKKEIEENKPIDIFVNVVPVVDPIKGKTIEKISIGELIYVRIVEDKTISKSLGKELNIDIEGFEGIIPGTIRKIEKTKTNNFEIEIKLREGIIGKSIIKSDIKIKTVENLQKPKLLEEFNLPMIYIFLGMGGLILFAIIIMLLIWK